MATVLALVLIFGSCGSLTLGALDKADTGSQAPLLDPGNLAGFVTHFIGQFFFALTTGTDHVGTPYHNYILAGAAITIEFCFLAMPLALLLGFALALMSHSSRRIVRVPARTYVEFFRDTPLLVQLLAIYWALIFLPSQILNAFTAGLATLVLNYAAYECENLRAGIEALDRGQGEAATALGLRYGQALRLVIVPQMIPTVLPPIINDLIYMYKDSAILSLITIAELTAQANGLARRFEFLSWQFYLIAACVYLLLSLPLSRVARMAEARLRSTSFVPRIDPVTTALVSLLAMAAVGWVFGVLAHGFPASNALDSLGELLAGIAVTVAIALFIMLTLGLVVYLLGSVIGLARRGGRQRESQGERQPDEALAPALLPK